MIHAWLAAHYNAGPILPNKACTPLLQGRVYKLVNTTAYLN